MKIFIYYIYCIYFPASNKPNPYYIGETFNLVKRMLQHLKSKFLVGKALNKYNDWQVTILHTCKTRDAANLLEKEEIRKHNCIAPNGYNLTSGGDGGDTFTNNPNKEARIEKQKETWKCFEVKEKLRIARTNKKHSKKTIEKIKKSMQGKQNAKGKRSEEAKANMKKAQNRPEVKEAKQGNQYGAGKRSVEAKANMKIAQNRPEVKAKQKEAMVI